MTGPEVGQLIALGIGLLGTGSWIGWTIRGHDKRLRDLEKEMPKKMDIKESNARVAALEAEMPKDLRNRLRGVEEGKLSIEAHAALCAGTLRTVELQVDSIKTILGKQEERLQKGDDLFLKLSKLAGRMEQHLDASKQKGGP